MTVHTKAKPHAEVSTPENPIRCTKKTKKGRPCKQWSLPGLDACRMHCGLSKADREAKARRNLGAITVRSYVDKLPADDLKTEDPSETLLLLIAKDKREETIWSSYVLDCDAADILGGKEDYAVRQLHELRTRLARSCKMALDAGIEERRVRIEEERGAQIAQLFITVIEDRSVNISIEARRGLKKIAARQLQLLEGGKAS